MRRLNHPQGHYLDGWVALEVGSHELTVPRPRVFGVRGGVDADKSPATLDEPFERLLLATLEDIPRRIEEDDEPIAGSSVNTAASSLVSM